MGLKPDLVVHTFNPSTKEAASAFNCLAIFLVCDLSTFERQRWRFHLLLPSMYQLLLHGVNIKTVLRISSISHQTIVSKGIRYFNF